MSDASAEAIKDAALYDPRVASFNIRTDVENGWATLRGTVDNLKAKLAAEALARSTVGIVGVTNRLKVRLMSGRADEAIADEIDDAVAPLGRRFTTTTEAGGNRLKQRSERSETKHQGGILMSCRLLTLVVFIAAGAACAPGGDEMTSENAKPTDEVTGEDVGKELSEAMEAVRGYTHEQREDLVRWSREQLAEVEATMAGLEERADNVPEQTRETWRETRDTLVREREALEERISELQDSNAAAWEDMKSATLKALEELERGVNEAANEFDEEVSTTTT